MEQKITIAIPIYNGEKYILETLQSIANQTQKVNQILICDNVSTDNSLNIIRKFAEEHRDLEIKIKINQSNIGSLKNFNRCMELSDTDFLLIIGCDDLLKPDTIKKQIQIFSENPDIALVGGQYNVIDKNGKFIREIRKTDETIVFQKGEIFEFIEKTASWIPQSMVLMRMKYIREIGNFDDRYLGFDELYWPKVLASHPIALLKDVLLDLREHDEQDGSLAYISKFNQVIEYLNARKETINYETRPEKKKKLIKTLHKQIANSSLFMARKAWNDYKKYKISIQYYYYSLCQSPNYIIKRYSIKAVHPFVKPLIKYLKPKPN